jgi:hypothetical protein
MKDKFTALLQANNDKSVTLAFELANGEPAYQSLAEERFLALMQSQDYDQVALAFAIAEAQPQYQAIVAIYKALYHAFFGAELANITSAHIADDLGGGHYYLPKIRTEVFPAEVAYLSAMDWLSVGGREVKLQSIAPEIGKLTKLRKVSFWQHSLNDLPLEMQQLKNLEILHLWENKFEALPTQICALPQLKVLALSQNQLSRLPQEITQLKNLEQLFIEDNPLPEWHIKQIREWLPNCEVYADM